MPTNNFNLSFVPLDISIGGALYRPKTPEVKKVVFNDRATIVLWEDGTKTVVKCHDGDTFSKELGLAMCIAKKAYGNTGKYNKIFKKWCK